MSRCEDACGCRRGPSIGSQIALVIAAAVGAYAVWALVGGRSKSTGRDAARSEAAAGPPPVWQAIDDACRQALKEARRPYDLDAVMGDKGLGFTKAGVKAFADRSLSLAAQTLGISTPVLPGAYPTDALFDGTLGGLINDLEKRLKA